MIAPGAVAAAMEELVLERLPDGTFTLCFEPPRWLERLVLDPLRPGEPLGIERLLPFVESFLPEAEAAWSGEGATRVRSGCWTEVTAAGEELHLEASALQVGRAKVLVITRDDTLFFERGQVLQRARELRLAHDALSEEIERKDLLIHCIVHDLAGPLGAILGVLSLLEERENPCPAADLVRVALQAALRQRALIREILDVFAAERSAQDFAHHDPDLAPDLCAEVAKVAEALEPSASSRGVLLSVPTRVTAERARPIARGGEPACNVVGEERRLARVLYNLIENAIRFTPAGRSVVVSVHDEPQAVRLLVEDEGPGVSPALVPRLFQKLVRGQDPASGTGLGLYFCRVTVESWGGGIGYEPRPSGGARFWVRLRRAGACAEGREARRAEGGRGHGEAPLGGR